MAYYWYRVFVYIADYANSIPQFRMLSIEDQVYTLLEINPVTPIEKSLKLNLNYLRNKSFSKMVFCICLHVLMDNLLQRPFLKRI